MSSLIKFLTIHGARVLTFMQRARQYLPDVPEIPTAEVRLLRAKLIMEEALETIEALGVELTATRKGEMNEDIEIVALDMKNLIFDACREPDLVGIADGCADISVVTIGTLLACGIQDAPILEIVDQSNLSKFGPGHSWRADGKLVKPPDFKGPTQDIEKELRAQGWKRPVGR